jgi:hypothetical protein
VAVTLGAACASVALARGAERPNILLMVADDLGYADLGCQGAKDLKTPHLDSIAANGVRWARPGAAPDERFKALGGTMECGGLMAWKAPDGLRCWRIAKSQSAANWSAW